MHHKFEPMQMSQELWADFKFRYFDILRSSYESPMVIHTLEVNSSELTIWFDERKNLFIKVDNKNSFATPVWYMVKNVTLESYLIIPAHPEIINYLEKFQKELKYKAFREGDNVRILLFSTISDWMTPATRMFDLGFLIGRKTK